MSSATTTAYTIHVSISIDNEEEPIEFNFLSEKLNWENLVNLIQSTTTLIEVPVILYYKKESSSSSAVVESLENQEQLESLLLSFDNNNIIKGLRFYGQKELVNETVYVFPGNAFIRLDQLVDQHKQIIASNRRLARWVGILASFIAQDSTDHDFDYEFNVLERLIEGKVNKRCCRGRQGEETDGVNEEDSREALFSRGGGGLLFGGRGGFFGRGGHYHRHGSRGGHHHRGSDPREDLFGRGGPCNRDYFFGGRGRDHHHGEGFGGRGGHHQGPFVKHGDLFGRHDGRHADFFSDREGPSDRCSDAGEEFGGRHHHGQFVKHDPFGKHGAPFAPEDPFGRHGDLGEEFRSRHGPFGGRGGHHHHRGRHHHEFGRCRGPFVGEVFGTLGFDSAEDFFSGDEKCGGKEHGRRHHHQPYGRGCSSSSEESSAEDDIRTLIMHLLKKHLKHGKKHENHFHFFSA